MCMKKLKLVVCKPVAFAGIRLSAKFIMRSEIPGHVAKKLDYDGKRGLNGK